MNKKEFDSLKSHSYTHIPVYTEIIADLDTPLSVYKKVANDDYSYIFESVEGGEKWRRYSIIGLQCKTIIKAFSNKIQIHDSGHINSFINDDPMKWIGSYLDKFNVPDIEGLPDYKGGLVGYFAYEAIQYIEPKLKDNSKRDELKTPDILLMLSKEIIVFDNLSGKVFIIVLADVKDEGAYEKSKQRLKEIESLLHNSLDYNTTTSGGDVVSELKTRPYFTERDFKKSVNKIKDYITNGDVMQVVLSQRISADFYSDPIDLYRSLRSSNPSPYMYYLNLKDHQIVGSSPEILVRLEGDEVTVRPIAGTRPRGITEQEDIELEFELLNDPKEIAEHRMLIDLGRNDAGRISKVGSVKLTEEMKIERYSHVMHIVSNVTGVVEDGLTAIDVLKSTFPAGTVSGAPKIRAMEIINELEPVKRGIYSGAVGYLSWNGGIDTAIAIRTAVIKNNKLYIQAGAGIVHDSLADNEWIETINKANALVNAAVITEARFKSN